MEEVPHKHWKHCGRRGEWSISKRNRATTNFWKRRGARAMDAEHLVITRRKNSFLMMNRYPYTVGHLMVVPYRKGAELSALGENEVVELWNLVVMRKRFCAPR